MSGRRNTTASFDVGGLERRGRSTERYAEYATEKGAVIWVRKPIGLTEEQCRVELAGLAKQYGFDPPDG
jgi:hypothetical protein